VSREALKRPIGEDEPRAGGVHVGHDEGCGERFGRLCEHLEPGALNMRNEEQNTVFYSQTVYNTKGTRAHTHRELIRKWLWEPKGSSLEYLARFMITDGL